MVFTITIFGFIIALHLYIVKCDISFHLPIIYFTKLYFQQVRILTWSKYGIGNSINSHRHSSS